MLLLEMKNVSFFVNLQQRGSKFCFISFTEIVMRWNITPEVEYLRVKIIKFLNSVHRSSHMKNWDNFKLTAHELERLLHF